MEPSNRMQTTVETYLRSLLTLGAGGGSMILPTDYSVVKSTEAERKVLGVSLLEVSIDWKRILSPMLTYAVTQEALVLVHRESLLLPQPSHVRESSLNGDHPPPIGLRSALTPVRKELFGELLAALKSLSDAQRSTLLQRHEAWVDEVREQVDLVSSGKAEGPKRVVHTGELEEMLKLGRQMKAAGNESFAAKDYHMAVVRYGQVEQLLQSVRCLHAPAQTQADELRAVSVRNTSLAALKAWEWRACLRACETVLTARSDDHVVHLRQAEALHQLGRTKNALSGVRAVLAAASMLRTPAGNQPTAAPNVLSGEGSDVVAAAAVVVSNAAASNVSSVEGSNAAEVSAVPAAAVVRKARRLLVEMSASQRRSNGELQGAMAKGLSRGTFSETRQPALSDEARAKAAVAGLPPVPPKGIDEPLRVKILREQALQRAKGEDFRKESKSSEAATASSEATAAAPQPDQKHDTPSHINAVHKAGGRRLSQSEVAEVQKAMASCFDAPEVREELNQMRIDTDFEEQRFLYRLKPLKARVLAPVLASYGFRSGEAGVREMERAVYAWMADDPSVGARGKALTIALMGAIWSEDAS